MNEADRSEAARNLAAAFMRSIGPEDAVGRQRLHELWGVFRNDLGQDTFREIAKYLAGGPVDGEREDALRVLATQCFADANEGVVRPLFEERLEVAQQLARQDSAQWSDRLTQAEADFSRWLAGRRQWKEALAVMQTPPSAQACDSSPQIAGAWYENSSALAERAGDAAAAADLLDRMLRDVPKFEASTGRGPEVRAKILELRYADDDPRKGLGYLDLWNTTRQIPSVSSLNFGNNAAILLAACGRPEAGAVLRELDSRFGELWPIMKQSERNRWAGQRLSTRIKLAQSVLAAGDKHQAFDLLVSISNDVPSASDNASYQNMLERCR